MSLGLISLGNRDSAHLFLTEEIRRHTETGRPLGNGAFVSQLEKNRQEIAGIAERTAQG